MNRELLKECRDAIAIMYAGDEISALGTDYPSLADHIKRRQDLLARLDLALKSLDDGGWVRVPREPTDDMLVAGNKAALAIETLLDDTRFSCERATYKAMISTGEKTWIATI